MRIHKEKSRRIAIVVCLVMGLLIIITDLLYSKVDHPLVTSNTLEDFGEDWHVTVSNHELSRVTLPIIVEESKLGDTMVLTKDLPKVLENDTYLFFRASHQNVKAYINDVKVHSFGWDEQRLFGKSPACAWTIFPISKQQAGEALTIELTGVYDFYAQLINEIYIGDKSAIIHEIISNRIGSLLICLVLMVLGVTMIIIALVLKNGENTTSLLRLGLLSVNVGIWSACVLNIFQLFYGNVFALLNIEFFTYHLLLPVALWFLLSIEHYKKKKMINILFWASILFFVTVQLLQLTNVADYMETVGASHFLIGISVGYLATTGFRDLLCKNSLREARLFIISLIVMIAFFSIDLFRFYLFINKDDGFYTRIGILFFIVMWAIEIIRNMSKLIVSMTRNQVLEILAYQDQMTGLKNRTAFEMKCMEYREKHIYEDAYVAEFDMNDLKYINDTYGHAKGDEAIIAIANIIKEKFCDSGDCYRIGGDEICVIIPATGELTEQIVYDIIKQTCEAIMCVSSEMGLDFSVASGYSKTSFSENHSIDDAYKEADQWMYERKYKMKRKHNTGGHYAED